MKIKYLLRFLLSSSIVMGIVVPFSYHTAQKRRRAEKIMLAYQNLLDIAEQLPAADREKAERLFGKKEIVDAINNRRRRVLEKAGFRVHNTFWGNIVAEHKDLPGWIIKGPKPKIVQKLGFLRNILRVKGAQEMKMCVKKHHLENDIIIPQKCLFHYPGRSTELTDENYCVLAQRIKKSKKTFETLTYHQAKALTSLIDETGYFDPRKQNFCLTTDGKIALIDTEKFSENLTINCIVGTFLDACYHIMKVHIEDTLPSPQAAKDIQQQEIPTIPLPAPVTTADASYHK